MNRSTSATGPVIAPVISKLIEVIEDENAALSSQSVTIHRSYTDRKNQALRELIVAHRRGLVEPSESGVGQLLAHLADIIKVNATLLKHHISAVGEVSDIIVAGLRGAESDGTYSRDATLRHWR